MQFNRGDLVVVDNNAGLIGHVLYQRMRPPDYSEPEAVSICLCGRKPTNCAMFAAERVTALPAPWRTWPQVRDKVESRGWDGTPAIHVITAVIGGGGGYTVRGSSSLLADYTPIDLAAVFVPARPCKDCGAEVAESGVCSVACRK